MAIDARTPKEIRADIRAGKLDRVTTGPIDPAEAQSQPDGGAPVTA